MAGGDLGTTADPVRVHGTDAVRKSMTTASDIVEAKLRTMCPTYDISMGTRRTLTRTDTSEGGCEWDIHFLNQANLEDRKRVLSDIIKALSNGISTAWKLSPARHAATIRLTPTTTGFQEINEAQKSQLPRAMLLVVAVGLLLFLAVCLGLI